MGPSIKRRELFTRWFSGLSESVATPPALPDPAMLPEFLRPPGARPESVLIGVCDRSHACIEACPHGVILPLGPAYGEAEGTPAILPRGDACMMCEDLPCAAACRSGALERVPLEQVRLGTAVLDPARCWSVMGQPCDYCVKECPRGEAALRFNGNRPEVIPDGCTGCGQCVRICTATPAALSIRRSS